MKLRHGLAMAASLAVIQGATLAQGRPEGGRPAAPTADHRHAGGSTPATNAANSTTTGQGRGQGREWTRFPLLLPVMARSAERGKAMLRPVGVDAASVRVFAADGPAERREVGYPVGGDGAIIEPAAPNIGNYHWVIAQGETESEVRIASTAWYFSNPGGAPTELLRQPRHALEIVPDPLPREHSGYRESEKWNFIVRYNGVGVPHQPVTLETEFGSRSTFQADAQGRVTVLFPRDFRPAPSPAAAGHDHGPRRAKFVLATERVDGGRRFLTAFNHTYAQDADRNRSLGWGAVFGLLGMVAATPLLRRRAAKNTEGADRA